MSDFFTVGGRKSVSAISSASSGDSSDFREGMTKDLMGMVLQFMEASGFEESYKTFWEECTSCGFKLGPPREKHDGGKVDEADRFGPKDIALLYKAFDEENEEELLRLWVKFSTSTKRFIVREGVKEAVDEYKGDFEKITFFLRIYIATIPFRVGQSKEAQAKALGKLREFFEDKTDEMSSNPKLLSLFALPFVAEPQNHPVFKKLFKNAWKNKLKSQINLVLATYCQVCNLPTVAESDLVQLYIAAMEDGNDERRRSRQRGRETVSTCGGRGDTAESYTQEELQQELKYIEENLLDAELRYHKLLKVAAEMVTALESALQGRDQDMAALKDRIVSVFPELFASFPDNCQPLELKERTESEDEPVNDDDDCEIEEEVPLVVEEEPFTAKNDEEPVQDSGRAATPSIGTAADIKEVESGTRLAESSESGRIPEEVVPENKDAEEKSVEVVDEPKPKPVKEKKRNVLSAIVGSLGQKSPKREIQKVTEAQRKKFSKNVRLNGPMPLTPRALPSAP